MVSLAETQLALRAREVLKVIEVGSIARMPRLPRAVVGITPYRGRIVTVIDPAVLLGQAPAPAQGSSERRVVLLDSSGRNVGLLVERVEVISAMDVIEPKRGISDDAFVVEVAACGPRTVGVIDGGRLARRIAAVCSPARA